MQGSCEYWFDSREDTVSRMEMFVNVKWKISAVVVLAAIALCGCESTRSLEVAGDSSSQAIYENGVAILHSAKKYDVSVRVLTPSFGKQTAEYPALYVSVGNPTNATIDFSDSNISVHSGKSSVLVYSAEKYQKQIKKDAAIMAFALALNGASQAMAASAPTYSTTSGTVNTYGSRGYGTANYFGTTTTYNPAAAAAAQAQINANTAAGMASVAAARNAQLSGTAGMLSRNTVGAGGFAGGVVRLDASSISKGQPLEVTIFLPGESHSFRFDVR